MQGTRHTDAQAEAAAFLAKQLGERAPRDLTHVATFDEQPLEGEGRVAAFAFELPPTNAGLNPDPRHYVFVGQTEPNYYPAYELSPEDAYSLHIGTRFTLVLGLEVVADANEPARVRDELRASIAACNPGVEAEKAEVAGLFRCAERLFAVYRVTLEGQGVYWLGADCPPGFCKRVDLPAAVALRLHLGRVLRTEARSGQTAVSPRTPNG